MAGEQYLDITTTEEEEDPYNDLSVKTVRSIERKQRPSALSKLKIRVARDISSNKTIALANTYPTIKL
jgi:hypothetical protein